jgi:hypothetical protein
VYWGSLVIFHIELVILGLGSDRNLTPLPRNAQSANGIRIRFAKSSIDMLDSFRSHDVSKCLS